jgi:hypothetical protein
VTVISEFQLLVAITVTVFDISIVLTTNITGRLVMMECYTDVTAI